MYVCTCVRACVLVRANVAERLAVAVGHRKRNTNITTTNTTTTNNNNTDDNNDNNNDSSR